MTETHYHELLTTFACGKHLSPGERAAVIRAWQALPADTFNQGEIITLSRMREMRALLAEQTTRAFESEEDAANRAHYYGGVY